MNDVSNYDVTLWHFDVKIYAKFIGSIILYFRPSLVEKTLEPTKLL